MTQTENMYRELGISPAVYAFGQEIEKGLKERFDRIDETAEYNQLKVVGAMQKNRVSHQRSVNQRSVIQRSLQQRSG